MSSIHENTPLVQAGGPVFHHRPSLTLGNLVEARVLIEVDGGTGSADFALAEVTATAL